LLYTGLNSAPHTDFWRSRIEAYLAGSSGTDLPGGGASRFGVFGPRTRRTRIAQHYRDWVSRYQDIAADSFSAADTDQLTTADSGHFWYKWSGDSTDEDGDTVEETPVPEPFRIVNNRCLPSDKIDNSAWAGLPMGVADVRIRCYYTHNASSSQGAGILFRSDFKGHGWLFHYHSDTHWYVSQIEPNVGGNGLPPTITHWQDFGTSPTPVPGVRSLIEVRLLGLTFSAYFNRVLVGTVTLSALGRSNTIHGVYAYGPNINSFDNISIVPRER
jgi:hypothetical protein